MTNKKIKKKILSYAVIYQAVAEGGYIAFAPSLPGCHTQGESLEKTEENIKEAIQLYLESLNFHKEIVPQELHIFQGRIEVTV